MINQVKEGEDYEVLKPSYVVFICSDGLKDNRELPVYTYCMRSKEDLKDELGDGSFTVFVNAKGNAPGMSMELREFLDYLKTGQVPDKDCFVKRLHQELLKAREHPDWRREYMTLEMKINDARAESRAEGHAEGIALMGQLYVSLKKRNRLDDYEKAVADDNFRDALLKELGLYPG